MKVHLACGSKYLPGYVNVDINAPKVDAVVDLSDYKARAEVFAMWAGRCEEVLCVHFLEHMVPWEVPAFLVDCYAILRTGGTLVLELPDLLKCCANVLAGERDQMGMWGLYGDPGTRNPYMLHRWSYSPNAVRQLLTQAGFDSSRIRQTTPHWHPSGRYNRDMRMEATR